MIVCHCKGISDRAIRAAIRAGARSCQQVGGACEAGSCCGGCQPLIHQLIERESHLRPARPLLATLLGAFGVTATH